MVPQPTPHQKRQVNVLVGKEKPTTTTSSTTLNTKPTPKKGKPDDEEEPSYEMAEDYNDESSPVGTKLDEEATDSVDTVSDPMPQPEQPGYYPPMYPPPQMWPPSPVWPDQSMPFGDTGTYLPEMYQPPPPAPPGYEPPSIVVNPGGPVPPAESGNFMRYETSNVDDETSAKVDIPSPVDNGGDGPRNSRRGLGYVEPPPQFTGVKGPSRESVEADDYEGVILPSVPYPLPVKLEGQEYVQGDNGPVAVPTPTPTVYDSPGGPPPVLHEYAGGDDYPGITIPSSSPLPVQFKGHEYIQGDNGPVAMPTPTPTPTPPVYYSTGGPPPVLGHEYAEGDDYPGNATPSPPSLPVLLKGHEYVQGDNGPVAMPTPTTTPTPTVYYSTGGPPPVLHEYAEGDDYPGITIPSPPPIPVQFKGHEYIQGDNGPVAMPTPTPTPTPPVYYSTGGPPPALGPTGEEGTMLVDPVAVVPNPNTPTPVPTPTTLGPLPPNMNELGDNDNGGVVIPSPTPSVINQYYSSGQYDPSREGKPKPPNSPPPADIPKTESGVEDTDDSIPIQSEYIGSDGRHPMGG